MLSFGRDYNGDVCGSEISHPGSKALGCDSTSCQQIYYPKLSEDVTLSVAYVPSFNITFISIEYFCFSFRYLCP